MWFRGRIENPPVGAGVSGVAGRQAFFVRPKKTFGPPSVERDLGNVVSVVVASQPTRTDAQEQNFSTIPKQLRELKQTDATFNGTKGFPVALGWCDCGWTESPADPLE